MTDKLPEVATLEVLNTALAGQQFPLREETLIGRCEESSNFQHCEICLPDGCVSRRHARIVRQEGRYFVQDLNSTNGTLLNAQPLLPVELYPLQEGSNLQLGDTHLRFRPPPRIRTRRHARAPWASEVGHNEAVFDLALVLGEDKQPEVQASKVSMVMQSGGRSAPDVSMVIDAADALKALKDDIAGTGSTSTDVLRRLRAMAQLSINLGGECSREDLLAKVMGFTFDIFPSAERAYVVLCDAETLNLERLTPVVALSRHTDRASEVVALSRTIVRGVIQERHSILSSDAGTDKRFDSHESIISLGLRSLMCVPLLVEDEVLGLIQMDTYSRSHSFGHEDLQILTGIGAQAAIALKNIGLVEDIQNLFEGFVTASVHAIEARDPSTAGHSFRVAEYSLRLAEAVSRSERQALRAVNFSPEQLKELRYAALLHDFGKVGVREHVLTKAKKLYPRQLDLLQARFKYARVCIERQAYRDLLDLQQTQVMSAAELKQRRQELERYIAAENTRMDQFLELIMRSNEPAVRQEAIPDSLQAIADYFFATTDGGREPLLSDFELNALALSKGSLTPEERQEIESHVSHTFSFLQHIPWTGNLAAVPEIAHSHHEKLDGSGYPRGIHRDEIPLQARIMTVADIYDALTAGDRPYKQSLPVEMALDILRDEARQGKVEQDLVDIFLESNAYQLLRDIT